MNTRWSVVYTIIFGLDVTNKISCHTFSNYDYHHCARVHVLKNRFDFDLQFMKENLTKPPQYPIKVYPRLSPKCHSTLDDIQ